MKEKEKKDLLTGIGFLGAFILWTILIQCIDVREVGPNGTKIGFAAFNVWFHRLTGVHMALYTVTDPVRRVLWSGHHGLSAFRDDSD